MRIDRAEDLGNFLGLGSTVHRATVVVVSEIEDEGRGWKHGIDVSRKMASPVKPAALSFHDPEKSLLYVVRPWHHDPLSALSEHVPKEQLPVLIDMLDNNLRSPGRRMS